PRHRVLGGAPVVLINAGHRDLDVLRPAGGAADRATHHRRPGSRRAVHPVRDRLPAAGHRAVRHRAARRVRGPHLPGGAAASALRNQRRAGAQAMTTGAPVVVFAYHQADVRLVVTHEDNPRETIWWERVADVAIEHGIDCIAPADANTDEVLARVRS